MDESSDSWSAGIGSVFLRGVFSLEHKDLLTTMPEKMSLDQKKSMGVEYVDSPSRLRSAGVSCVSAGGSFAAFVSSGKVFIDGPESLSATVAQGSTLTREVPALGLGGERRSEGASLLDV
jgi:hypothetical protein